MKNNVIHKAACPKHHYINPTLCCTSFTEQDAHLFSRTKWENVTCKKCLAKRIRTDIDKLSRCPVCKCSWDGGDIPEAIRERYSPPYKYSRLIGIEDPMLYDGVSFWKCPDCGAMWDRFTNKLLEKDWKKILDYLTNE